MTSHYVRLIIKARFDDVFESLSRAFGNIYSKRIQKGGGLQAGIILGEEYFFRVNSDVAVLIILDEHMTNETCAEIISCAGGSGLLGISYAAHSSYVHDVLNHLRHYGFEVIVEEEISYFGRSFR